LSFMSKQGLVGIFALLLASMAVGQRLPEKQSEGSDPDITNTTAEFRKPIIHVRKLKDGTCDTTGFSYKAIPREVFTMGGTGGQAALANHNFVKPVIGRFEIRVHNIFNDTIEFSTYGGVRATWNYAGRRTNEASTPIVAGSKKGEVYSYVLFGGVGTASKLVNLKASPSKISNLHTGIEGGVKVVGLEDVNYVSSPPTPGGSNPVTLAGNKTTKVGPVVNANILYVIQLGKKWSAAANGWIGWDGVKYNDVPKVDVDDDNWGAGAAISILFHPFGR
jgi:hypothetical protein